MSAVRTPQQPRSIQTKNRIIAAAFSLYAKKGIHGTNSREIAAKAGVSIGSFYSYFKNKKTLLLEMLDDYLNRHFLAIWKAIDTITINEMKRVDIRRLVESVFAAYGISPEFHRQTHALRYSDPDINKVYERERAREVTQIRYLLESNRHRMRISDPEAAAVVIHNAVENVAHTAKFIGPKSDENALIDALSDMVYDFLLFGRQQE